MSRAAAYLGEHRLTGVEHEHLPDSHLLHLARQELDRIDPHHATGVDGQPLAPRDKIEIVVLLDD